MARTLKPISFSFVPPYTAPSPAIWNHPTPTTSKTMNSGAEDGRDRRPVGRRA